MSPFPAFQALVPDINFALIAPELIVGVAAVIVMLVDAFTHRAQQSITTVISIVAMIGAAAASVWLWVAWTGPREAFNGMIVLDDLRLSFTLI